MLLREPNNTEDKEEYQTEKPSCTRIRHYLPDHGDTTREDSVSDACNQLAAKLGSMTRSNFLFEPALRLAQLSGALTRGVRCVGSFNSARPDSTPIP